MPTESTTKGSFMRIAPRIMMVASLVMLASGAARADGDGGDNGMSPYYGDSWADLHAHTPNMPTGPLQALQDRDDARAAFAHARDNARATMHRWRDDITHMMHRESTGDNG
jgi:hypothetical protein